MKTLNEAQYIQGQDRRVLLYVRDAACRLLPGAKVLLYGSVARGTQNDESDYDILILTDTMLDYSQQLPFREAVYELELEPGIYISLLFRSHAQWNDIAILGSPFRAEVEEDAIVL